MWHVNIYIKHKIPEIETDIGDYDHLCQFTDVKLNRLRLPMG